MAWEISGYLLLKMKNKLRSSLWLAAICLLTIWVIFGYQYKITYNHGNSMEPTYQDGDFLIVERKERLGKEWVPDRYDHVIVSTTAWEKLSKRVIGLEGERIEIKHGKIWIDGKKHSDPFSRGDVIFYMEEPEIRATKPKEEWMFINPDVDIGLIPKGWVFIIGDNRNISWYGKVRIKDIKGLVIL